MRIQEGTTAGVRWDADLYDDRHSFVWRYGAELLDLLTPERGERILDVGCGTGHLTARIAECCEEVIGLDSSPLMIEHARQNYPHVRFRNVDARDFFFRKRFDAVFSNAALHWIRPPGKAAACIYRALKPGGRFVAEFGGKGNIAAIVEGICAAMRAEGHPDPGALNPWYYPSLGEYASLLETAGFRVVRAEHYDRSTLLEGGPEAMRNWLAMFAGSFLGAVPADRREAVIAGIERRLRPRLYRDGAWRADYRRLRVVARREGRRTPPQVERGAG